MEAVLPILQGGTYMDTMTKLQELSLRLDHLENSGDWLSRTMCDRDDVAAQTGTLVVKLAEDIRYRMLELVTELEKQIVLSNRVLQ